MKRFSPKLSILTALAAAFLLASASLARDNQGHHQSGVALQVTALPGFIAECNVTIVVANGGVVATELAIGPDFRFDAALKPGAYYLIPSPVSPVPNLIIPPGSPVLVTVDKKNYTNVTLTYTPVPQ